MVTSILQISKLRLSEVKSFGQLHKKLKCKRQSWDLNRGVHLWSTTPSKLFVCSYCLLNRELEGWKDLQQLYRPAILFCSQMSEGTLGCHSWWRGGARALLASCGQGCSYTSFHAQNSPCHNGSAYPTGQQC